MNYRIGDKMEIEKLKNRMKNLNCEIVNIKSDKDEFLFLTTNDNYNILTNTIFNIIKEFDYEFIGVKINENKKIEAVFIKNLWYSCC